MQMYLNEAKKFSQALSSGASGRDLEIQRNKMRMLSGYINQKYTAPGCGSARQRNNRAPHGD